MNIVHREGWYFSYTNRWVFFKATVGIRLSLIKILTLWIIGGFWLPVTFSVVHATEAASIGKNLTLIENGKSAYSIYVPTNAIESVKTAGAELQRVLEISTNIKLPVVNQPLPPMIALGASEAAKAAGIDADKIPDEGFRVLTKDGNLYIAGKDWPDDQKKWNHCDSTGTLYGVYEFVERVVGVRWLAPGPLGEDIPPHKEKLEFSALDFNDAPSVV